MARKAKKSDRTRRSLQPNTSWLRYPILSRLGLILRVLIYARFSTDEQNPLSVDAQVSYCRRFLEGLGVQFEFAVLSDEGISGERIWRPGINMVREGIERRAWDLILVEDSSRLFRNAHACLDLVMSAVDQKMRTICINDFIDTAEEDWEDKLSDAQRHHTLTNKFTIRRIRRAQESRWENNEAMGPLRSGYLRRPKYPPRQGRSEEGPYIDEVDPRWQSTIYEAFERIAASEPPWAVGRWLDEVGLPGINGDTEGKWTARKVIALIRQKLYRGAEDFRQTVSTKHYGSGDRKLERAKPEERWERDMPELRMVPDWLWFKANEAIAERTRGKNRKHGADHPLAGIPRDSRGPLSRVFYCGCGGCGAKMNQDGRSEGGYRCSAVTRGLCWNKATAVRDDVHNQLKRAICDKLQSLGTEFPPLVVGLERLLANDAINRSNYLADLERRRQDLECRCDSLAKAIEIAEDGGTPLERLTDRLIETEGELNRVKAEMDRLVDPANKFSVPTVADLAAARDELVNNLQVFDRSVGTLLERLIGTIKGVPYQQFGCNKVVLRATFEIDLRVLMPRSLVLQLIPEQTAAIAELFPRIPMLVDLFDPPTGPKYGLRAVVLREAGKTFKEIGQELGFRPEEAIRRAEIAVSYGLKLRAADLTDPYVELKDPPAAASRWRTHPKHRSGEPTTNEGEAA